MPAGQNRRMRRTRRSLRSSPLGVAACVLVLYSTWIAYVHYGLHRRMSDFASIGVAFSTQSDSSRAIDADRQYATSLNGYDGQFFLYIAQDPHGAKSYIDDPAYRYGRIVYPLLARALALGRSAWAPFMLVAINVLAVALGTFALATLLCRHGRSSWYALIFALYPGTYVAVQRDLSEPLAYALAACAVALFDRGRRRDLAGSAALFALAGLTRETTLVFALVCIGLLAARDRGVRRALPFAAGALLPSLLYREVLLRDWFGGPGTPRQQLPTLAPFSGILHYYPWSSGLWREVYAIVLPGVLCLALALWALVQRRGDVGVWALGANALLFVVFLPTAAFQEIYAASRVTLGIVIAFVVAIPALTQLRPSFRWWGAVVVLAWMAPWWVLNNADWLPFGRQFGGRPAAWSLAVAIQGSAAAAEPGHEVDFTVWSTNAAPLDGYPGVVLRIELPPGLALVGPPYHERGPGCTVASTVTCQLDSLGPHMGTPIRFGVRMGNVSSQQTLTALLSAQGLGAPKRASFTIQPA
jgi:hypothetical protein